MTFSEKSKRERDTCHPDLILVLDTAIQETRVDFGINQGHRSPEKQFEYYRKGRELKDGKWVVVGDIVTTKDGYENKGKHNIFPSRAFDVFAYADGIRWDDIHLSYLGGLILGVADRLLREGKITHRLTWGADWDNDGLLVYDHRLKDLPHFQI